MRRVLAAFAVAAMTVAAASSAHAERRMFIISSNADGYGVDRCLVKGEKCGAAAAAAYCHSQKYAEATSFRKVDRDDITGAIPNGGGTACKGASCDEFVAIVCTR
jgi:hypothetical protein